LIRHGTTNKLSEYALIDFGVKPIVSSFSPFSLYKNSTELLLEKDKVFLLQGNYRLPLSSSKEVVKTPMPHARLIFLMLFGLISILFAAPLLKMLYERINQNKKTKTKNET
jgi:hypothetical protein